MIHVEGRSGHSARAARGIGCKMWRGRSAEDGHPVADNRDLERWAWYKGEGVGCLALEAERTGTCKVRSLEDI